MPRRATPAVRRWRLTPASLATLALLGQLGSPAQAAAYLPSAAPDPATGPVGEPGAGTDPAAGAAAGRGNGIEWRLAPWRMGGTLTVDLRSTQLEDGRRVSQALLLGDVDWATHVWQPWFVQLRLGLGWVASAGDSSPAGVGSGSSAGGLALTGRMGVAVFPASRFPLEVRAELSDSRTSGIALGADYRSQRVTVAQSYRPATGNDMLQMQFDRSVLDSGLAQDTLTTIAASAMRQARAHQIELNLNHSDHERSDSDERTRLSAMNLSHGYQPSAAFQVNTLASWNEARLGSAAAEVGSEVQQLSSLLTWRGSAPLLAGLHGAPLFTATARWVGTRAFGGSGIDSSLVQALNATLGLSQDLSRDWRATVSASAGRVTAPAAISSAAPAADAAANTERDIVGASATLNWAPQALSLGDWRYAPNVATNASQTRESPGGTRSLAGLQAGHGVSRDYPTGASSSLSLGFTQSAAVLKESGRLEQARAIAHGASVTWQSVDAEGGQAYGALSWSDSHSLGSTPGRFQMVNLQLSQRQQLSRYSSFTANFTAQASHNQATEIDAFSGQRRDVGSSAWRPIYNGSAGYENQRAFDVPRLRLSVLFAANSQQLEQRSAGDIEAPRERISHSLEGRLDHSVGRLDTRLALRVARVDGRTVNSLQARAQRRF